MTRTSSPAAAGGQRVLLGGPMARLADVTVGCRDRPGMGWMTTLAGTVLIGVCKELPLREPGFALLSAAEHSRHLLQGLLQNTQVSNLKAQRAL